MIPYNVTECNDERGTESRMQFLLVKQRHGGFWGFPKGYGHKGETEQGTALREFEEETGISRRDIGVQDIPSVDTRYTCVKRGKRVCKTVTHFFGRMEVVLEPRVCGGEILDAQWVEFAEALVILGHEENQMLLTTCHQQLLSHHGLPSPTRDSVVSTDKGGRDSDANASCT